MAFHNDVGKWGEQVACETLVAAGYAITERNWRSGHYEVDIIAQKGVRIIFVEVKTSSFDDTVVFERINLKKQQRIISSAAAYMRITDSPLQPQFDAIAVLGTPQNYRVVHLPDAFFPRLKTYR